MIRKLKLHNSQAGFTLVELLVSTVVMAIVGLAISEVLVIWANSARDNNDKQNIHREMDLALKQIDRVLMESSSASVFHYNGGNMNLIVISLQGGGTTVFRFDPATGALERDGVNIISSNIGESDIVADNLFFQALNVGVSPNIKRTIRTTLSLSYLEARGTNYVVRFTMTTTLRNS